MLAIIANRRRPGSISRKNSSRLPASSAAWIDRPVTLPPGRAKLATKPVPSGSTATANTMGIAEVTCFTETTALPTVTMTSTLEPDELSRDLGIALGRVLPPSDIRSRRCGLRSSRARAAAAQKRRPKGSTPRASLAPRNPMVGSLPGCCAHASERLLHRSAAEKRDELAPPHRLPQAQE